MTPKSYTETSEFYDREAAEYDKRYWNNPVLQQLRQSFREEVKRHPFSTMLEVGCGTGIDLVHFGLTNPVAEIHGIDISSGMITESTRKIRENCLGHVFTHTGSVEDCGPLFGGLRFDMIYVFFGALNTVGNLSENAVLLGRLLKPDGVMVLTFVNKWYLASMLIEGARFRFKRATARLRSVWTGYSPNNPLPSRCYSPREIRKAFRGFRVVRRRGYSIVQPAWYFTGINLKIRRFRNILQKIDQVLNRTPFWRFGEYTLFTFEKADRTD